jgi:hypothetical protein
VKWQNVALPVNAFVLYLQAVITVLVVESN